MLIFNFSRGNFENDIDNFNILPYIEKHTNLILSYGTIKQISIYYLWKLSYRFAFLQKYRKKIQKLLPLYGLYDGAYFSYNDEVIPPSKQKNSFALGLCENPICFDDIKEVLQKEFTPKHALLDCNKSLYEKIILSNSVCVTIRRGDYISNNKYFLCDKDYFMRAIAEIKKRVTNPVFIFFSDEISWVRDNIKIEGECYYERGNDPIWEKMRLMYSCKHFILSNSSFSWWAQYLSRNPDKIVISPSRWHPNPGWTSKLIDKNFVKIEIE